MNTITEKLSRAVPLHQENSLDEAEEIYRQVLSEDPEHADACHLLGLIEHQRGMNEAALRLVDQAISSNASIPAYHINKARILRGLGRSKMAVEAARVALELEPGNAETYCELAGALLEIENSAGALIAAKKAYQLAPDLIEPKKNLALAHFREGCLHQEIKKYKIAEKHYRAAVPLQPNLLEALVNLGNVLRM